MPTIHGIRSSFTACCAANNVIKVRERFACASLGALVSSEERLGHCGGAIPRQATAILRLRPRADAPPRGRETAPPDYRPINRHPCRIASLAACPIYTRLGKRRAAVV